MNQQAGRHIASERGAFDNTSSEGTGTGNASEHTSTRPAPPAPQRERQREIWRIARIDQQTLAALAAIKRVSVEDFIREYEE